MSLPLNRTVLEPQGQLTSPERKELNEIRRDLKWVQLERDFLTAGALSGGLIAGTMQWLKAFLAHSKSSEFIP
jgi:hypothetical protein